MMELFKKENGHTLLEVVIVLSMIGMILVLLWTSYLSVHRNHIRANNKALNLEEARLIINHLTDNVQTFGGCKVVTVDGSEDDDGYQMVKEVKFEDLDTPANNMKITYEQTVPEQDGSPAEGVLKWTKVTNVEVASEVSNFKAKLNGELLELKIELVKKGHGVIANQIIEVGTTLNLKYMSKGSI